MITKEKEEFPPKCHNKPEDRAGAPPRDQSGPTDCTRMQAALFLLHPFRQSSGKALTFWGDKTHPGESLMLDAVPGIF